MNSFFLNFSFKYLNFSKNFFSIISLRKYLENKYKNVAPIDKLIATTKVPIHLPKINPPRRAIGVPKPNSNTQKIVKIVKIVIKKK